MEKSQNLEENIYTENFVPNAKPPSPQECGKIYGLLLHFSLIHFHHFLLAIGRKELEAEGAA